jgi:hypothetical protein
MWREGTLPGCGDQVTGVLDIRMAPFHSFKQRLELRMGLFEVVEQRRDVFDLAECFVGVPMPQRPLARLERPPTEALTPNPGVNPTQPGISLDACDGVSRIPFPFIRRRQPPPTPGLASFNVTWSGMDVWLKIGNDDPVYGGFAGTFIRNAALMEWTATVGDFTFASAPLAPSVSSFAEIGRERNGIFFPL